MKAAAPIKTIVKRTLELLDPLARQARRLSDPRPIPPMRMRARTGGRFVGKFIRSGENCAKALNEALAHTTGRNVYDYPAVLDFGVGCGRTLMQWDQSKLKGFTGCDVDKEGVDWLAEHYPRHTFVTNQFDPPFPFGSKTFDLVYAVSVFSHFSEEDQRSWLAEVLRILRPGGVALLTTQGKHALHEFSTRPGYAERWAPVLAGRDLDRERFIFAPYPGFKPGSEYVVGVKSDVRPVTLGLTFISRGYLESEWTRQADLLGVFEGTVDNLQDAVVLRKNN